MKGPMYHALQKLIKDAPKLQTTVHRQKAALWICKLTPALASEILEACNQGNRKVRQGKVAQWAGTMKNGEWMLKSTFEFFESGQLHDGQHRMKGCVMSGVTIPIIVQVIPGGREDDASKYTGIEVVRSLADYLHFNDVENAARVAPVLMFEKNFRVAGSPFQWSTTAREQYLEMYREMTYAPLKVAFECLPRGMHKKIGIQRSILDWLSLALSRVNAEDAQLFFEYVHEPVQLKKNDPMYVLHQRLGDMLSRKKLKKAITSTTEQAHAFVKSWNLHYDGAPATPRALSYRANEEWPLIKGTH